MRRSMLFLPGNAPNMLINGACLGADAVILDLEDAVAPSEKDAARTLVRNTMRYMDFKGCEVIVRINSIDTPFWQADLDEILPQKPNLILLPKTGQAQDALEADAYMSQVEDRLGFARNTVGLMPLIETALGVENAFSIASASPRVAALFLGVYDTPFTDVNDDEGIRTDAELAKALGFTGKASISPRHVEVINQVFSPTEQEIDYAYKVMDAIRWAKAQGKGAVALYGKMIDAPIVARAEQTIAAAREMGLGREEEA